MQTTIRTLAKFRYTSYLLKPIRAQTYFGATPVRMFAYH